MGESVKLTNLVILESAAALSTLGQVKLPAKVAYVVAKTLNKLVALEKTVRDVQKTLWENYGEKDATGKVKYNDNGTLTIPADNKEAFVKEHNALLNESNEISDVRRVTLNELSSATIEPSVLMHLEWFIKDE